MPIQTATLRDMVYRVQPEQKPRREAPAAGFAAELTRAAREPVSREAAQPVEPQQSKGPEPKRVDKKASSQEQGAGETDAEQSPVEATLVDDSGNDDASMEAANDRTPAQLDETTEQAEGEIPDEFIAIDAGVALDAILVPIIAPSEEAPTTAAPTAAVLPVVEPPVTGAAQPPLVAAEMTAPTPVVASPTQPVAAPDVKQQVPTPDQATADVTAIGEAVAAVTANGAAEEAAVVGETAQNLEDSATPAEPKKAVTHHAPSPSPTIEAPAAPQATLPEQAASAPLAAPEEPNAAAVAANSPAKAEASPATPPTATPVQAGAGEVAAAPAPTASTTDAGRQNPDSGAQLHDARQTQTLEDRVNERINAASVARGLRNVVQQGGGSLTMRLTPHEMGTVRVQMQLVGTAVSAQFHTESEAAHSMLSQQLTQLRSTLESQGLSVERLNVQMMPSTSSSSSSSQASTGQHQAPSDQGSQQQQQASDGRSRGFLGHDGGQGRQPNGRGSQREAQEAFRRLLFNQVA